jgi:hypothetical protein
MRPVLPDSFVSTPILSRRSLASVLLACSLWASAQVVAPVPTASTVLTSIAVTPANPSATAGSTLQFKATGTFTGGSKRDITSSVTWTSTKTTVATISSLGSTHGLATAIAAGTTTIKATHGKVKGTTVLTVIAAGPSLVSITVAPPAASINMGTQQQFTATGNYSDGSTQDVTSTASWSSSAPSVATVSTTGLAGTVASGQATIQAAIGSISGSAILTITQFTHVYVAFPPPSGVNNTHFLNAVLSQPAIEGVVVPVQWATIETGTPGPGTCSPVGTDVCQ